LCRSLCPSIYGHEMVKAGLVLGLFGGTQRYVNDKVSTLKRTYGMLCSFLFWTVIVLAFVI